ncbi:MAG: LysM peptidoglycan-binding domain-containing protein [Ferruginibacter sp.]
MILRLFTVITALFCCAELPAQEKTLMIEGTAPNIYLVHTIAPKENIYSIGRLYNTSPKDQIAPFNNLQMDKPLSIGQTIKIPLAAGNFVQDGNAAADEALIPVYHIVAEKEGLYRISTNYNKVPMETLRQWNNIKTENVGKGIKMIVGYLKVKKELSAFASMGAKVPVTIELPKEPKTITTKTEVKKEPVPVAVVKPEKPAVTEPIKKDPVINKTTEPLTAQEERPDMANFKGGFFKHDFSDLKGSDGITENGAANVFKSTSGWHDGKYYCLHNSAAPGTIIKITSNTTGKSIYAKVLDIMPDIKQNSGLLIRISNAAAEELGVGENKFDCSLSYSK